MTMHIKLSVLFVWQVDSVLGPLQLSLYKMLGDVWEFLLLFLVLHLSFATGLAKMYSYYVASQLELHRQNMTCLLYTSPSPRDLSTSRMPSSA